MKRTYLILLGGILLLCLCFVLLMRGTEVLTDAYEALASHTITDRHGAIIYQEQNDRGGYSLHQETYPKTLQEMVVAKEDAYFYFHPGINPASIVRALAHNLTSEDVQGASTITQQLVKILREQERERTLSNKISETLLAFGMELRYSKEEILTMYLNSANLGNQANGFAQASLVYFDKSIENLSAYDQLTLVATLSNPHTFNPWQATNEGRTQALAALYGINKLPRSATTTEHQYNSPTAFEVRPLVSETCNNHCITTIDAALTEHIRSLVKERLTMTAAIGGTEMAVVVISVPENEILAVVGSPDPFARDAGSQINMSLESRPIGSTIKPFIYAEAFERGARPYSLVTDQEYRYPIGSGFPLYPKNFDGTYQGDVTLEYALANSLNTPSIKLLEFISLEDFYELLEDEMHFSPLQPLATYAYGIALGGLEMDLLTLTHYFTTFPQGGVLHPLHVTKDDYILTPQSSIDNDVHLFSSSSVQLLDSILTERQLGASQFGLASTLALPSQVAAVKTGTSRDFHDSWTVGYTPDYVVGVWLGNAANNPLDKLSGSIGAGPLWRQTMELLQDSAYDKKTPFSFPALTTYPFDTTKYYGLPDDDVAYARNILLANTLIVRPHQDDVIALSEETAIELRARSEVRWSIDDTPYGSGTKRFWTPTAPGTYTITATANGESESHTITVVEATLLDVP